MSKYSIERIGDFVEVRYEDTTFALYSCKNEKEIEEAKEQAKEFIRILESEDY